MEESGWGGGGRDSSIRRAILKEYIQLYFAVLVSDEVRVIAPLSEKG